MQLVAVEELMLWFFAALRWLMMQELKMLEEARYVSETRYSQ